MSNLMVDNAILGIDVGASGIKGALVDVEKGKLLSERLKLATPKPSTPKAMAETVKHLVQSLDYRGEIIGCGFPSIIKKGVAWSAANIHKSWIGTSVEEVFSQAVGIPVKTINDADAAGLAEAWLGKARDVSGVVILITIGSGLGSAILVNGRLVPNTELGHLYLKGMDEIAERYAANSARKREKLDWKTWGRRFDKYLRHLELLFSPDLFLLGGGISKRFEEFAPFLKCDTPVQPAAFFNNAGLIGAALYASQLVVVE